MPSRAASAAIDQGSIEKTLATAITKVLFGSTFIIVARSVFLAESDRAGDSQRIPLFVAGDSMLPRRAMSRQNPWKTLTLTPQGD